MQNVSNEKIVCIVYTNDEGKKMGNKHIVKIRISPQLNEKILQDTLKKEKNESAKQKKKSIYAKKSTYVRMQLEEKIEFLPINIDVIQIKIENDINNIGIKINYKARLYNTYGVIEVDIELRKLLKDIVSELSLILNLLAETKEEYEDNQRNEKLLQYESEKKTIPLTVSLNEEMYRNVKNATKEKHISMSKYIRERLAFPSKYTKQDVRVLRQKIHHQIYPIVSNVEQICFRYAESNIKNIVAEIQKINEYISEITYLENQIMNRLEV